MGDQEVLINLAQKLGNVEGALVGIEKAMILHDQNDQKRHDEIILLINGNKSAASFDDQELAKKVYSLEMRIFSPNALPDGGISLHSRMVVQEDKFKNMRIIVRTIAVSAMIILSPLIFAKKTAFNLLQTAWGWVLTW